MTAQSDSAVELVLAVDAGGTKTAACFAQSASAGEFQVLGRGQSTGGNPLSIGFDAATHAIETAVAAARADGKFTQAPAARAVLSIAGAANPEVAAPIVRWAHDASLAERIAVVSDVLPILAAGTDELWGVALIAGTGSVAFGRAADGRTARCGGWGYLLGDDGSGYAIGRAALRYTLAELELQAANSSSLTAAMLSETKCSTAADLTKSIYARPSPRAFIAALASGVVKLAEAGDEAAQSILIAAAQDLAALIARTAQALGLTAQPFSLAVAGGVLVGSKQLREEVAAKLIVLAINSEMHVVADPLEGCLRLADPTFSGALVEWH